MPPIFLPSSRESFVMFPGFLPLPLYKNKNHRKFILCPCSCLLIFYNEILFLNY